MISSFTDVERRAFVQIDLEFHEALLAHEISSEEYALGVYLACEASFFTKRVTTSLARLIDDLEWDCSSDTAGRRLAKLEEQGFIAYDVKRGARRYSITVTSRLLYDRATSAPPPHHLRKTDPTFAELASAETSATTVAQVPGIPDPERDTVQVEPPLKPPQEEDLQERYRQERENPRGKDPHTPTKAGSNNERETPLIALPLVTSEGECKRHPTEPKPWCLECKAIANAEARGGAA